MTGARVMGGVVAIALGAAVGCGHTHTVDQPETTPATNQASPPRPEDAGRTKAEPAHKAPGSAGAVPVSTSAMALLAPDGATQIREKLKAGGYLADDGSLADGLRRFQEKHDLPATGMPDHQTVAKLGLDPGKIFRHADVK